MVLVIARGVPLRRRGGSSSAVAVAAILRHASSVKGGSSGNATPLGRPLPSRRVRGTPDGSRLRAEPKPPQMNSK